MENQQKKLRHGYDFETTPEIDEAIARRKQEIIAMQDARKIIVQLSGAKPELNHSRFGYSITHRGGTLIAGIKTKEKAEECLAIIEGALNKIVEKQKNYLVNQ